MGEPLKGADNIVRRLKAAGRHGFLLPPGEGGAQRRM